jgi:hypothetical protein
MNLTDEEIALLAIELAGNGNDVIERWKKSGYSSVLHLEKEMYAEIARMLTRTSPRPDAGLRIPPIVIKPDQDKIVAAVKKLSPF